MASPAAPFLRIAVASTSGDVVDQHLGQANRLYIFETSRAGTVPLARRELPAWDGNRDRHRHHLAEILSRVEDCAVVVANRVGPGLHDHLERRGIHVLISDQEVGAVLERISRSHLARYIQRKECES
ncbi:MAG TPA: NifB/NifX family molybdenum-iron cluster-binding protein [Holophaga sp.]|nr:NifB/NifX family molybdenum-iron cluster-binding protein [Holophaga sp.]